MKNRSIQVLNLITGALIGAGVFSGAPCSAQGSVTVEVWGSCPSLQYYSSGDEGESPRNDGGDGDGGGVDNANPEAPRHIIARFKKSVLEPNFRVLGSLGTNKGGVKLSFQNSNQSSVKATYGISPQFAFFNIALSGEYASTRSWELKGEYTTPRDGYWLFNAEEEIITDYYDIVEIIDNFLNESETVIRTDQQAQKQNHLYYNVYGGE